MAELKAASLVKSRAGRDKDELYIIIRTNGEYVYLSDGRKHPVSRLKRKNRKHLQPINKTDPILRKKLTEGQAVEYGEIRSFISSQRQQEV